MKVRMGKKVSDSNETCFVRFQADHLLSFLFFS